MRNERHPGNSGEYAKILLKAECMENLTENIRQQMRKSLIEYCILLVLSKDEAYASTILDRLKDAGMTIVEGTLYPLLIRQKNQGLLTYRWEESTQGPPRKYYSITDKGRQQLNEMDSVWDEISNSINILKDGKN